jgi:hypothetical protein
LAGPRALSLAPHIEPSEVLPLTIYLSLLVALIGLLMYALCANPKLVEIGRLSFFAGILAFLIVISGAHVLPVLR